MRTKKDMDVPFCISRLPQPPTSPLFPYTTLFRSFNRVYRNQHRLKSVLLVWHLTAVFLRHDLPWHGWKTAVKSQTSSTRSEEHTSELQSHRDLVCRLLLEKKKHHHWASQPRHRLA